MFSTKIYKFKINLKINKQSIKTAKKTLIIKDQTKVKIS